MQGRSGLILASWHFKYCHYSTDENVMFILSKNVNILANDNIIYET